MRILLLTLYFAPDIAANAVVMTELAEERSLGHQVTAAAAFPHYTGNVVTRCYREWLIEQDEHKGMLVIRTTPSSIFSENEPIVCKS